jgi:outer membrane protein OmpA-like peptidoglycan-associated protein
MSQYNQWTLKGAALAAVVFATGCAEQAIHDLEKHPRDEIEFNNSLANEYEKLAKKEDRVYGDFYDAELFAVKGLQAASGGNPMPEDPTKWDNTKSDLAMLQAERERLLFALARGGRLIIGAADVAAGTQVAYDCWVAEAEAKLGFFNSREKKDRDTCKKLFMTRIGDLETAVFTNGPVRRIHFDYNSARIEHDGNLVVNEVVERMKMFPGKRIMIVGHTDPLGKHKHNRVLSHKRAIEVKNALVAKGVPASSIKITVGRGELATSRNRFEPNNRAADIYFY